MGSTTKLTTVLAAVLAAGIAMPGAASAADLLVDPPVVEAPEVVTPAMGRWYLRGDISYSYRDFDSPVFINPDVNGAGGPGFGYRTFDSSDLDDGFGIRGGLGVMVNDYVRVEATVGYDFDSDFSGSTVSAAACAATSTPGTTCISTDTDEYTAFKLMANAYIDLGTYSGFTPYIGAGIGGAHVSYDGLQNQLTCVNGAAAVCTPPVDVFPPTPHGGEESWRFAWALHAGFAYSLSTNLKLDVGYSYERIEDGAMFRTDQFVQGVNTLNGTQGFDRGIEEHTIRAGLRYHFW